MHSHRQGIEEALTTTKSHLEKLHSDIGRTLEKISSREKYLNNQLGTIHKLRRQKRGEGMLAKCLFYYISLCSKLAYGGGRGVKNW